MFKFLVSFLTIALFCVSLAAPSYGARYGGGSRDTTAGQVGAGGLTQQQQKKLYETQVPGSQTPGRY